MSLGDTKTCSKCHTEKPRFEFSARSPTEKRKGHIASWCKACCARWRREYVAQHREQVNTLAKLRRQKVRMMVLMHYANGPLCCNCCGETTLEFLTLDHIDGNGAEHRRQHGIKALDRWLYVNGYPEGFQVLCFGCNAAKGFYGECPHETFRQKWPQVTIHRPTHIDLSVKIGVDSIVWRFSEICQNTIIGDHAIIGSHVFIGKECRLGHDVHLQSQVFLPNHSMLGDRVFIGPSATFTDDKNPRVNHPDYHAQPPVIGDDVSIGAGAVILPGVRLGRGCIIGAGAVVTRDVPAGEVWLGLPARKHPKWPEPPEDGGWLWRVRAGGER